MTGEEMERAIEFILEQQAHMNATVGRLAEKVDLAAENLNRLAGNVESIAGSVDLLGASVDRLAVKVDRNAEGISALLAIAEIHESEMKKTDDRLNALIDTVERHISEGRNGKS